MWFDPTDSTTYCLFMHKVTRPKHRTPCYISSKRFAYILGQWLFIILGASHEWNLPWEMAHCGRCYTYQIIDITTVNEFMKLKAYLLLFQSNLDRRTTPSQVRPNQGLNRRPLAHDSPFRIHVTETPFSPYGHQLLIVIFNLTAMLTHSWPELNVEKYGLITYVLKSEMSRHQSSC